MSAPTHTVINQPPPLVGYDVYATDPALVEGVDRHASAGELPAIRRELTELGRSAGSTQAQSWAEEANTYPPVLRAHDRYGNRLDEVEYHPSYHRLLGHAVSAGLTDAWSRTDGHLRRAAGFLVWTQAEAGHGCPVSMTHAAVPALRADPSLAAEWEPRLTSRVYDPQLLPSADKPGALFGMGMTEKQGGSDVRANRTRAEPLAADCEYVLTGHKWFCSAPMSDGFLVLAQAPGGLTCFLVPRVLPDGTRNTFLLQRLKNKLGNRSNASSEVEFDGTWARRVGEEGRGVATIIEMVAATRLDCSTAAYDADTEQERAFRRIAVSVAKFWITKRCPAVVVEALECLGGNGYVEDSGLPRLLRESPLNSVWEGSGNIQALDVLRALQREPQALNAFLGELGLARGTDHRLDSAVKALFTELADLDGIEARARRLVERMALVLQGSLLVRFAPPEVADAFCASRLGADWGATFGTLPHTLDLAAIVDRTRPVPA
jgi:putative acyl-CoA dehydrogenase